MLFADTSALYAVLVPDDAHHADAVKVATDNRDQREQLWTIDPVLTELWLLLRRDVGPDRADNGVAGLLMQGLQREHLRSEDFTRCWAMGDRWSDQRFCLTDRQAFTVMERTNRLRAWSYDKDFAVIRLGLRRNRALDIVR